MKVWKHGVSLSVMLAVCVLMIACPEPGSNPGGLQDEFEVVLSIPQEMGAREGGSINDDGTVINVYAKVFNSAREHLPSNDPSGITLLTQNAETGIWSATVRLASGASGLITFFVWGKDAIGEHLYSGTGTLNVPTEGNSITVTTKAGYAIGDMGPGGGYIFYNKGSYSDDWRYLEAARASNDYSSKEWGGYGREVGGTGTGLGTGKCNTEKIVAKYGNVEPYKSKTDYAAKLCSDLIAGGYSDWFLPSKDELALMYSNLKDKSLGGFSVGRYWSSSEDGAFNAWAHNFYFGVSSKDRRDNYTGRVRPARAF